MKAFKISLAFLGLCLYSISLNAQSDSTEYNALKSLFGDTRLKVDTTPPPEDSLTSKIRVFRSEKGPVSMDNVIRLSIEDAQSKDTARSKEYYARLLESCQAGYAHRIIENILVNLYRNCFTEKEMDQMIELYKTSLGKKMFVDLIKIAATAAPAIQDIVHETGKKLEWEIE